MPEIAAKPTTSAVLRLGKKFRPTLNRWIEAASLVPLTPVLDPKLFTWTDPLQANWRIIQAECDAVLAERDAIPPLGRIAAYHRRIAPDDKWRTFFFDAHGYEVVANRARCPNTAALLDGIPDLVTAFYSVMEAGTHVPRHKGFSKALINIHLGLRVPAGVEECRISVADQDCGWEEGRILMFDESFPHEVWNDSAEPRTVLFIQVMRPMRRRGRVLAHATINFINRTKYVQQARRSIGATRKPRTADARRTSLPDLRGLWREFLGALFLE